MSSIELTHFVTINSADVQPIAATRYFISVLPQIRVRTKCKPMRSKISTVFFSNSYSRRTKAWDSSRGETTAYRLNDERWRFVNGWETRSDGQHLHELNEQVEESCLHTFPEDIVFRPNDPSWRRERDETRRHLQSWIFVSQQNGSAGQSQTIAQVKKRHLKKRKDSLIGLCEGQFILPIGL